jgi:hypothetical protein
MSGFIENTAHNAPDKPGRPEVVLDLATASKMVPLVRGIVADILEHQRHLAALEPELDDLDRQRRTLAWPKRQRRYQVREEIATATQHLQQAFAELEALGVALLDPAKGRVGFPTVVNNRQAFFSWQPGEDRLTTWHFVEESVRRTIPPGWFKTTDIKLLGKS